LDPAYAESILPIELLWFKPFIRYLPPLDLTVDDFCALPMPDFPAIDALQLFALVAGNPYADAALAGFNAAQLVHRVLWALICRCKAGEALPPVGPFPALPPGAPALNPPSIVSGPGAGTPCLTYQPSTWDTPAHPGLSGSFIYNFTTGLAGSGTSVTLRTLHQSAGAMDAEGQAWFHFRAADGSDLGETAKTPIVRNGQSSATFSVAARTDRLELWVNIPAGDDLYGFTYQVFCGGDASTPCCGGSDPRLLATLTELRNLVQLVQRYAVPFATIAGAAHSGQLGTGSFSIDRLIGMRVDITSHLPGTVPDLEGNPPYVWDQGWMSITDGGGMLQEKRISQTHFDWLPPHMGMATSFGFALRPGTIATFTELEAEP